MVDVFIFKMGDRLNIDVESIKLSDITRRKARRIETYHNTYSVQHSIIGEILARVAICSRLLLKNEEVFLARNEFNKPFLKDSSECYFNISHSGNWIVCAVSEQEIGIDIEQVKNIDYTIAESIFTKQENKFLNSKNDCEKQRWFYQIWTMKESYVKAIGKGLHIKLNDFNINLKDSADYYVNQNSIYPKAYFHQPMIDCSYRMSVCMLNRVEPIRIIDVTEILEDLVYMLNMPSTLRARIIEKFCHSNVDG